MSEIDIDNVDGISLADLAGLDVSEIQELRAESLPNGSYTFACEPVTLTEGTDKENRKRFEVNFKFKVVECKAVMEKGIDPESLVGKFHSERRFIRATNTVEMAQDLGYLRGFITDLGANSAGPLGGVGGEPGILDELAGHEFPGTIKSRPDKNDPTVKYARMTPVVPKKK